MKFYRMGLFLQAFTLPSNALCLWTQNGCRPVASGTAHDDNSNVIISLGLGHRAREETNFLIWVLDRKSLQMGLRVDPNLNREMHPTLKKQLPEFCFQYVLYCISLIYLAVTIIYIAITCSLKLVSYLWMKEKLISSREVFISDTLMGYFALISFSHC